MAEMKGCLAREKLVPQFQFVYRQADAAVADLVHRALVAHPAALVLIADASGSAWLVREARAAGFEGEILGGPAMGRRRFLEEAGPAAEGAIFPLLFEAGKKWSDFEIRFQKRFQRSPDYAAACTYDAVQLLVAAVRKAGLNRARIGDAIRGLSPWDGVAGVIRWDTLGGNTRPARLGHVRLEGRGQRAEAEDRRQRGLPYTPKAPDNPPASRSARWVRGWPPHRNAKGVAQWGTYCPPFQGKTTDGSHPQGDAPRLRRIRKTHMR